MKTDRTKIKLCGLSRICDVEAANELKPEYIGFVFAPGSRRFVSADTAAELKKRLNPDILAVGVFVEEDPGRIVELLQRKIIDLVQLHGKEDEGYIRKLRDRTDRSIIKAFSIASRQDVERAARSSADYVLLDCGAGGTGKSFDWQLAGQSERPCFLAGGLHPGNVKEAIESLHPYAVDVSSGIETDGLKNKEKMKEFVCAVRTL